MRRKLFGNRIQKCCAVCQNGRLSADGEIVLCAHKGVMAPEKKCRKFVYDPLQRIPMRQPVPESFSAKDFSLDD